MSSYREVACFMLPGVLFPSSRKCMGVLVCFDVECRVALVPAGCDTGDIEVWTLAWIGDGSGNELRMNFIGMLISNRKNSTTHPNYVSNDVIVLTVQLR